MGERKHRAIRFGCSVGLAIVAFGFLFSLICRDPGESSECFWKNDPNACKSFHRPAAFSSISNDTPDAPAHREPIDLDFLKLQMDEEHQVLLEKSDQIHEVAIITLQRSLGVILREEYLERPVYSFNVFFTENDITASLILYCSLDGKVLIGYGYSD